MCASLQNSVVGLNLFSLDYLIDVQASAENMQFCLCSLNKETHELQKQIFLIAKWQWN